MDIWEKVLGFMDSQVVMTAEEMGVFAALEKQPASTAEIARLTDLPVDSAQRLMTMLCAIGVTRRRPDGRYANSPEASAQLVPNRPGYIGAMFRHIRHELYPNWRWFEQALREGKPQWERAFQGQEQPTVEMYSDPEALRSFMDGMHTISYEAAVEFARNAPEMREVDHLVDLGGASGAFVIALAQQFPELHGTVFDLPEVGPIAEDYFRRYELVDQLDFEAGTFLDGPIPQGADAYSMGFILHDWNHEQGSQLLGKVAEAVRPGGLLIVGEYLLNDDKTGPLFVARSSLNMLVSAQGRERSAQDYRDWFSEFGFELERIQPTSKGKNFMIARQQNGH